jgi:hypothetical protein
MFSRKKVGLRGAICIAVLLGLLASASPALASTAKLTKYGVEYTAAPGEANAVTINDLTPTPSKLVGGPNAIQISDFGASITPVWPTFHRWGCEAVADGLKFANENQVWCALEEEDSLIFVELDDLDDRFSMEFSSAPFTSVGGGTGDDTLLGGPRTDNLRGSDGDDELAGRGGNDYLAGHADNDQLDGGFGSDMLAGGAGRDTADYSTRNVGVEVTLSTLPAVGSGLSLIPGDDGEPGETDNVFMDVENVLGGAGDDTLVGSNADNSLHGNGGDDWLVGHGGNDFLRGGAGMDGLNGSDGDDYLDAGDGDYDAVDCGNGTDTAYVDAFDFIIGGCESVQVRP